MRFFRAGALFHFSGDCMAYRKPKTADIPKELFILSGELRGVSVPLAGGNIRLGTSSECDVVLLNEPGDESEAVISSNEDGTYAFEAIAGSVRVGRHLLKTETPKLVPSGARITVGSVEMALASSFDDADRTKRANHNRIPGALWAVPVALGLGVLAVWGFVGGPGSVVAKPSQTAELTYVIDKSGHSQSMVAAKALKQRLGEDGFRNLAIVGDQSERMVTVMGRLRQSDRARWLETVEWFDQSFGKSVYLDAKISVADDEITLPFSIETVWVGQVPRVTLHDGSRRIVGQELPGGWLLVGIGQESVTISKAGETLNVAL